ncbi:MAG: hypothetical protein QCI38_05785 [Candidatus Thermoplasmatota archaeon]|nr:hypothetical protein [Candidatus Thermoplasmatota archaeon]
MRGVVVEVVVVSIVVEVVVGSIVVEVADSLAAACLAADAVHSEFGCPVAEMQAVLQRHFPVFHHFPCCILLGGLFPLERGLYITL